MTYERLGELVSAVDRLTVMLRDRLPSPEGQRPVTGLVRLTEPDRPAAPDKVSKRVPGRLVEPAVPAPVPLVEPNPDPEPEPRVVPDPPPRAGRGSSLTAWQAWADQAGVPYGLDDKRDDIIAAAVGAGLLPEGV